MRQETKWKHFLFVILCTSIKLFPSASFPDKNDNRINETVQRMTFYRWHVKIMLFWLEFDMRKFNKNAHSLTCYPKKVKIRNLDIAWRLRNSQCERSCFFTTPLFETITTLLSPPNIIGPRLYLLFSPYRLSRWSQIRKKMWPSDILTLLPNIPNNSPGTNKTKQRSFLQIKSYKKSFVRI